MVALQKSEKKSKTTLTKWKSLLKRVKFISNSENLSKRVISLLEEAHQGTAFVSSCPSSKSFITLYMLRSQAICESSYSMDLWVTRKFVQYYGYFS